MINKDKFLEIIEYVASRQAEIEVYRKTRPYMIAGLCIIFLGLFLSSFGYYLIIAIVTIILSEVVSNYYKKRIKNDILNFILVDCAEKWKNNLDSEGNMTDINICLDCLYTIMNYKFES